MKKNQETKVNGRWQQWRQSPSFFKNFFSYFIIIFLLILSSFILFYRYVNKTIQQSEFVISSTLPLSTSATTPTPVPTPAAPPTPAPAPQSVSVEQEIALQNNRLTNIENNLNQQQLKLQTAHHQLIAYELIQGILEGHLPLKTLTLYLQKKSEPWATNLLNTLSPLQDCETYAQLQDLLVPPASSQPLSPWQHVKNLIKRFVSIRKLDAEGHYKVGNLSDIQTALHRQNIQQALDAFGKLSPEEQVQLSTWKQAAQNRLTLETIKQKLLLELSEG